jgi:MSHA biogenesis protein MshJ
MTKPINSAMIKDVVQKIDGLSLRERSIAALTMAVGTIVMFLQLIWAPWFLELEEKERQVARLDKQSVLLQSTVDKLDRKLKEDPDYALRVRNSQLQQQLAAQEKKLVALLGYLVRPEEMVDLLQQVLSESGDLRVVKLESLPVEQVFGPAEAQNPAVGEAYSQDTGNPFELYTRLFSHRVRLEIEAGFFDTLGYLQRLESLESGLLFDRLRYKVEEYPRARVILVVQTIGLHKEWLGV